MKTVKDFFNQNVGETKRVYKITGKIHKLYLDRLGIKSGLTVLDVGCGSGFFSWYFNSIGCKVTSIDFASERIKFAKNNINNVNFILGDFMKYKFKNKFDIVFAAATLMHINDYKKALEKMIRLVKKDGSLILIEPYDKETRVIKNGIFMQRFNPRGIIEILNKENMKVISYNKYLNLLPLIHRFPHLDRLWLLIESFPILKPRSFLIKASKI